MCCNSLWVLEGWLCRQSIVVVTIVVISIIEIGSYCTVQPGLELTVWPRLALNPQ